LDEEKDEDEKKRGVGECERSPYGFT